MVTEVTNPHPWIVTGPWYRWSVPGDPRSGRYSRPELQKYASSDFVNAFLDEPQRSLRYTQRDRVRSIVVNSNPSRYDLPGKIAQLTSRRKIFLTTHSRFYLVTIEAHCDVPGWPQVASDQILQAGFVVRRVRAMVPEEGNKAVHAALAQIQRAEARLEQAEKTDSGRPKIAADVLLRNTLQGPLHQRRVALLRDYIAGKVALEEVVANHAIELQVQGWFPSEHRGIGRWTNVANEPEELAGESVFPLYPLSPDPQNPKHSGANRGIFFGVLPTGGSDVDSNSHPRFDDQHLYQVQCFVQRRKPDGCPGIIVWSRPTQGYQLASHFDIDGTSHRPVTIRLPDLDVLQAQVNAMPPGGGGGVRVVTPPSSDILIGGDVGDIKNRGKGNGSTCFYAAPLITFVAFFVLRLFIPVVIFIFRLWFMLRLKFCIPPSFELEAGLAAELKADIEDDIDYEDPITGDVDGTVEARVNAELIEHFGDYAHKMISALTLNQRAKLVLDLSADLSATVGEAQSESHGGGGGPGGNQGSQGSQPAGSGSDSAAAPLPDALGQCRCAVARRDGTA